MSHNLTELPLPNIEEWETRAVLKQTALAHRYLAELKGVSATIPNEAILINTLTLQEAKHSSEIENIITTHDELFKAELFTEATLNPATKEVQDYAFALRTGFSLVRDSKLIRLADILEIQQTLESNKAGFRKLPGTELKNTQTGEVVYTPPQHPQDIVQLMDNLVQYINDDQLCGADPLVKMAIIHHQFESIHPFYDGNGRTGRLLNMLYLIQQKLLDIPVLYLSSYIIRNKNDYYRLLQEVRTQEAWEEWIIWMLNGVEQTAKETIIVVNNIKQLMSEYKTKIKKGFSFYSHDLINCIFKHPYTKIDFLERELKVHRNTASSYLKQLEASGLLAKVKIGRSNYYINIKLLSILKSR